MKLYTLEYNCNVPTTQQINVPTNTDYKVGIKVKRNGKGVNLKPAEVTIGTLSADDDLVNGYLTFTGKTMDDPFMKSETINIEHGNDVSMEEWNVVENTTGAVLTATALSVDLTEYAGQTLKVGDLYMNCVLGTSAQTKEQLEEGLSAYWNCSSSPFNNRVCIQSADGSIICTIAPATRTMYLEGLGLDPNDPVFMYYEGGTQLKPTKTYTIKEGDVLYIAKDQKVNNGRYLCSIAKFEIGEPFDQKFKLTTNVFKSQQGDVSVGAVSSGTVTLAGAYSDDTEFSYDLLKA